MKIIIFSLMAVFCSLLSPGQHLPVTSPGIQSYTHNSSGPFLTADNASYASSVILSGSDYDLNAFRRQKIDDCASNHKKKTKGIILLSIGGALLIPGIALVVTGVYYPDPASNGLNNIAGGVLLLGAGAGCLFPGIPLTIVGSVKCKKYCNGARTIMLSTKGNSLALNF